MKSVCRRLRLPLRNTGGFTFTKIEDATAGRLIIGPRNSLTQLAWARQAERKRTADSGSKRFAQPRARVWERTGSSQCSSVSPRPVRLGCERTDGNGRLV